MIDKKTVKANADKYIKTQKEKGRKAPTPVSAPYPKYSGKNKKK